MAGLDTLEITNAGLNNINKKIIGSRVFSGNLITTVGSPIVVDGVASNFSPQNYFTYSPLNFVDTESLTLNFQGTFFKSDDKQCAFELIGSDENTLTLFFRNTSATLLYADTPLVSFSDLPLEKDTKIRVFLVLKSNKVELTLSYDNSTAQKVEDLSLEVPLTSFNTLNLGSSSTDRNTAWQGTIDLKQFSIYNNTELLYAPSEGTSWNFSHILISDGKIPLTDSSTPVANHIYKFPITEIKRSGSSLLMICAIDKDTYLTIKEMGLYIKTSDGYLLFGSIGNLNINKTKEVAYNLVFTVNTTINVVNAIGFPADGDIVVTEPEPVEFKDFVTVEQVNTYVLTNLERIIRMNAGAKGSYLNQSIVNAQAGIGYNRPQVVYRVQQKMEQDEDCYNSLDTFVKLTNRFQKEIGKEVDLSSSQVEGTPVISENGETSNFSSSNYIYQSTPFSNTASWEVKTEFITGQDTSGTVVSLSNQDSIPPLELSIMDNKCRLKIRSLESIYPSGLNSYYLRNALNDIEGEVPYFAWIRKTSSPCYNFHCPGLTASSSSEISFPRTNAVLLEHGTTSSVFTFSTRVYVSDIINKQYIIGNQTSSPNEGFELFLENGKIQANLYEATSGNLIGTLVPQFTLRTNRYYTITLSYDGSKYTLRYQLEPVPPEYAEEETITLTSSSTISLADSVILEIGSQNNQSKLNGKIDFLNTSLSDDSYMWRGASSLGTVYTVTRTPISSTPLYDEAFYEVAGYTAGSFSGDYVINNDLFTINNHSKYTITISYSENSGTGTYEVTRIVGDDETTATSIFSRTLAVTNNWSNRMGIPTGIYVGVKGASDTSSPFTGVVNLLDFNILNGDSNWNFSKEVILNNTELLQYYRVPDLNMNQYTIRDICSLQRVLKLIGNRFEGREDLINFLYPEGLTLCMKVDLKDSEPKVLLYKSDLVRDIYFALTFENQTMAFTILTSDGPFTVSKKLDLTEYSSYTSYPIMITAIFTPQYDNWGYLKVYKNNEEMVDETYININPNIDPSTFVLSNYLTSTEDCGRFLQDLVVIRGAISTKDLKYINSLFDTNY